MFLHHLLRKLEIERLWLSLIMFFACTIRVWYLGSVPMWMDEAISSVAAKAILLHGYPVLKSGVIYDRAWIFHYIMAFFLFVLKGDFGARFVSVVFGVLTVYLGYLFGKKLIRSRFGSLGFSLLLAFSATQIIYSKQARMYQAFVFLYFLSFYLFHLTIILNEKIFKKRFYDHLLLLGSISVAISTHQMGWIIVPLLLVFYLNHQRKNIDKRTKIVLVSGVFLSAVFLMYTMFPDISLTAVASYGMRYLSFYFGGLLLGILPFAGLLFALRDDPETHIYFATYSLVPFVGLFFLNSFGLRYGYFIVFPSLFYIAFLLNKARLSWVLLIALMVLNLGTGFSATPSKSSQLDSSAPAADYRGAYAFAAGLPGPLVSAWTPASVWYGNGSDYWIRYHVNDFSDATWTVNSKTGRDAFADATVIDGVEDFPDFFVLVLDAQAKSKMPQAYLNYFDQYCKSEFASYNIEVFSCAR